MPPGQGKPAHPSRHEGEIVYLVVNAPSALLIEPLLVADFVLLTEHDADPFGARKNAVIQGGPVALMAHRLDNAGLYHRTFDDRNDAETAACAAMN